MLAAGLITLARTIPTIVSSFRDSMKDFSAKGGAARAAPDRARHADDASCWSAPLLLAIFLAVAPGMPTQGNFLASILIVIFGFFFVTVSSRIVGLIGSSSNPISGMTIATLILTCTIFVALGWTGDCYSPIALCVGAVVCIAAANAGATSQDLKTGYIVGATPIYQQYGLIIGVLVSALIIGYTTLYLHSVMTIGSDALPAPQATLMSTIIKGLLSQNLPWGLVLVGVFISITLELCGIHSLSFAVGSYLPIATTAPIFAGGLVRAYVEKKTGVAEESEVGSGTLFSSGLIAGGSLAGILYAVLFGNGIIHDADGGDARPDPVDSRRHGRPRRRRAALLRAGRRPGARRAEEARVAAPAPPDRACAARVVARVGGASLRQPLGAAPRHDGLSALASALRPVFFHGTQVAIVETASSGRARSRGGIELSGATPAPEAPRRRTAGLRLLARAPVADATAKSAASSGISDACSEDDSRFSRYDFRPLLEAVTNGRWPARDQVFVILGATMRRRRRAVQPDPSGDRAGARDSYANRSVTVTGRFRGRNLYGDLPAALNSSRSGISCCSRPTPRSGSAASGREARASISIRAPASTPGGGSRWPATVQARGQPRLDRSESPSRRPPTRGRAPVEVTVPATPKEPPPTVIFSAPVPDETDVDPGSPVRIQFSRDMDAAIVQGSRARRVRASRRPAGAAPTPSRRSRSHYNEGNRALEIKFAAAARALSAR